MHPEHPTVLRCVFSTSQPAGVWGWTTRSIREWKVKGKSAWDMFLQLDCLQEVSSAVGELWLRQWVFIGGLVSITQTPLILKSRSIVRISPHSEMLWCLLMSASKVSCKAKSLTARAVRQNLSCKVTLSRKINRAILDNLLASETEMCLKEKRCTWTLFPLKFALYGIH